MSDSVVERVADRLEIRPEQTDQVLRTLAQLIKKQSARDGRVRVPGLGVFQQADDTLVFEPDPVLAETINGRYAGLETVPLSLSSDPAMKTPAEEAPTVEEPEAALEDEALSIPPPLPHDLEGEPPADSVAEEPAAEEAAMATEEAEPVLEEDADLAEGLVAEAEEALVLDEDVDLVEEPVAEGALILEGMGEDATSEDAQPAEEDLPEEPVTTEEAEEAPFAFAVLPDYDDPDISEAAAYGSFQDEAGEVDADEEVSEWAPPGSTWSRDDLDKLLEEPAPETDKPEEDLVEESEDLLEESEDLLEESEDLLEESEAAATMADVEGEPNEEEDAFEDALSDEGNGLPPPLPPTQKVPPHEKPPRRSMVPWALGIGTLAVVGIVILYLLGLPPFSPTGPDTPPAITETTPTPPTNPPEQTPTDNTETPTDNTETPPQPPPAETPTAPGQGFNRSQGGYTLVVASFPERSTAQAEAERFRQRLNDASLSVDVIEGDSNGSIRYRVAIGQVPTVDEATALRSRLSDNLPEGTWVTSIPSDS